MLRFDVLVPGSLEILLCALAFSMRLSELSLGYGKFEYKRVYDPIGEGLTGQMAYSHEMLKRDCTPYC